MVPLFLILFHLLLITQWYLLAFHHWYMTRILLNVFNTNENTSQSTQAWRIYRPVFCQDLIKRSKRKWRMCWPMPLHRMEVFSRWIEGDMFAYRAWSPERRGKIAQSAPKSQSCLSLYSKLTVAAPVYAAAAASPSSLRKNCDQIVNMSAKNENLEILLVWKKY